MNTKLQRVFHGSSLLAKAAILPIGIVQIAIGMTMLSISSALVGVIHQ